ncbi:ATP-binding protein [Vibrio gazogenes]|uniref:ATP-dependent DNA helicase RecG n=1 Tax=Vibrio gazogenes TaxID=687 RepID=A0A1Z2SGV8_VIBGA|nr:ATP-binding protein [Vibrio gazogenes]ASA56420.1 ATP-dependent DNA helicase RecG [Vibrio gazogenes]
MIETKKITAQDADRIKYLDESHFLDLKSKAIRPAKLTETISAFANTSAGEIYVGIEENDILTLKDRHWNGFNDVEEANGLLQAIERLSPLGNHYKAVFYSCDSEQGLILHLTIYKTSNILFASNKKAYIRRGAQKLPIESTEALKRLKYDKGITTFEDSLLSIPDEYITNSVVVIEFMINVVPMSEPESWLKNQLVFIDGKPTVAGVLLFAEEPQAILPKRSAIKIYRYHTANDEGERDTLAFDPTTVEGHIYTLIETAKNKVKEIVEKIQKLGPDGLENILYPEEALQEIITNAVIHRDYSIPKDIHIRIFDNRIEIESPGRLPGHITLANILDDQSARNPKIIRLINKFPNPPNKDVGEGLKTAFEAMNKLRLKEPEITETDASVIVILRHESLSSPEQMVMDYLSGHENITNAIARELTGIKSENTMKDVFYRLRDRGEIEPVPGRVGRSFAWQKS